MSRETKIVYGMGAMALLVVAAYLVLWKISSAHLVVHAGRDTPEIKRLVDRDLELVDANGTERRFSDLEGKVWLVSHVFTRCPGQCSGVCAALDEVVGEVAGGEPVHLVSVSLDPAHDRPRQLREFSQKHDLVRDNWWFVTGDAPALNRYMKEVFWLSAQERPEADRNNVNDLFIHDPRVVLVDHRMRIRGWYDPFNPASARELAKALKDAVTSADKSSCLPALNATLNALAACFIIGGLIFIKRGRKRAHIACMVTAIVVSAAFLTCYLVYHYAYPVTKFTHPGWPKVLYLTILFSHIPLAVMVVPLVLLTVIPALRQRFDRHKRVARWTYPVWLYVSVTGVLIYLMLHRWFPPVSG